MNHFYFLFIHGKKKTEIIFFSTKDLLLLSKIRFDVKIIINKYPYTRIRESKVHVHIIFFYCISTFFFCIFCWGGRLSDIIFVTSASHIDGGLQAPIFFQEPLPRLLFSNDTGSQISCSAHGNPAPTVTWVSKDGTVVASIPGLR